MQVKHDDHRDIGANDAAHDLEQVAVGIVDALCECRAMARDKHRIERSCRLEAGFDLAEEIAEETLLDRAAWLGERHAQRHRRPLPGAVHLGEEARQVRHGDRRTGARLAHDAVATDIDVLLEVGRGGDRRESIALYGKAEDGDARVVLGQRVLLASAREKPRPAR